MAYPTILIDAATGSDSAASGAGPTTALTGTAASTDGAGTVVTLDGSPDLSGVATDGSHVIYLAIGTAGARNFSAITAKDNSAKTVTVANAFGISLSGLSWAIGGKRASIGSSTSIKLASNNSTAGDTMPGWTIQMQSGHTETIASSLDWRRAGDSTDGPITFQGEPGAATLPILTFSNNGSGVVCRGAGQVFQYFELRNTNATKTASTGISSGSNGPALIRGLKIAHSTDKFWKGVSIGNGGYKVVDCDIGYCANVGIDFGGQFSTVVNCYIHHCTSHGVLWSSLATASNVIGNVIAYNGGDGVNSGLAGVSYAQIAVIMGNTFHGNTGDGLELTANTIRTFHDTDFYNNIFSYNGGYGVNYSGASASDTVTLFNLLIFRGNNFYQNTSGKYNLSPFTTSLDETTTSPSNVTISATTDYAGVTNGSDFSIGTNLKATGYPVGGSLNVGTYSDTESYVDPGASQRAEPPSSYPYPSVLSTLQKTKRKIRTIAMD